MEIYMPLILDAIAVIIIFICMRSCAKKGFVRTIIQFAGYLISLAIAGFASKIISVFLYDTYIRSGIVNFVENSLAQATNQDMIISEIAKSIESLPSIISGIFVSGTENITNVLPSFDLLNTQEIAMKLTDIVFAPMVMSVMRILIFFVIFIVVFFIVKTISKLFTGVNYIPLIGPVNALLGGAVGILEAFLLLYIGAMLIDFVLIISGNSLPFISREAVNSTYLFSKFFEMKLGL